MTAHVQHGLEYGGLEAQNEIRNVPVVSGSLFPAPCRQDCSVYTLRLTRKADSLLVFFRFVVAVFLFCLVILFSDSFSFWL